MANNMFLRFATHRAGLTVIFVICIFALLASFRTLPSSSSSSAPQVPIHNDGAPKHNTPSSSPPTLPPTTPTNTQSNPRCDSLPQIKDTLIVVKTGANEVYEKLPTQLLTALECYSDILIFSDLEQKIGHYDIHDALADVDPEVKKTSPDFEYYRTLQEYKANRQELAALKEKSGQAAWNLDKFKFLHMLEKTWKMRKGRKWYVFIEADTYLVQTNLLLWLDKLDHTKPLYMGSPTYIGGDAFSHGGSGYILSGEALKKFADGDEGIAQRHDKEMGKEQFGDYALMKALKEKGVEFTKVWPMLQAEKPSALPFGPGPDNGIRHWCQPIVTMHHITSDEASRLWQFEGTRKDISVCIKIPDRDRTILTNCQKPLLLRELYEGFVSSHIVPIREDWYNLSDDQQYRGPGVKGDRQKPEAEQTALEKNAYKSVGDCKKACEEQERCWQYVFHNSVCGFSYSFRLGHKREKEDQGSFTSGFMVERIKKYVDKERCEKIEWLTGS